jgi:uncharacterized protein involved in response to NO
MNTPLRMLTAVPPPTPWERLIQVPHRAYFSAGVLAFFLLALWWCVALPLAGLTWQPPTLVHGLMMPLGIFPPFMLGFVFTAGPKWLGTEAPSGHLPLAVAQVVGLFAALIGFALGGRWPLIGLFILFIVWWRATGLWANCVGAAPPGSHGHARCILAAMLAGNVAMLAVIGWVLSGDGMFWLVARNLILWAWIVPIFIIVSHRMIPFFTQSVVPDRKIWRPMTVLYGWLGCCAMLVVASTIDEKPLALAAGVGLTLSTAYVLLQWSGMKLRGACGGNRLLAMLYVSFTWLPIAFLLHVLESAGVPVGAAAAHALGMGFCTTMMVGFVTRVTLGHGGRALQASIPQWYLYLGLHAMAALRVLLAILGGPALWLHLAATAWLLLIAAWSMQMLPLYWKPRADGKPG